MVLSFEEFRSKGTYMGVRYSDRTTGMLQLIQYELGLRDPVPFEAMHSTIVYSRRFLPKLIPFSNIEETVGQPGEYTIEVWESKSGKNVVVLPFDSEYLTDRHNHAMRMGATYDYDVYRPHITLAYDEPSNVKRLHGRKVRLDDPIEAVSEYVTDLDLDWSHE